MKNPEEAANRTTIANTNGDIKCVFSVDVEDWFHINGAPSEPACANWGNYPSHVSRNFRTLLEILAAKRVRATCFFLGWVAEQFPELVKEAQSQGHEIACHGYAHRLVFQMSPDEFLCDIKKAKAIIENISGAPVLGYRAPSFSVTAATPWFFDKLAEAGFQFDSSVFPAPRQNGGLKTTVLEPSTIKTTGGEIAEFPLSVAAVLGRQMCFFGGGYLRLFPYPLIKKMGHRVLEEGRPLIFYVHPREINPDHPRLPMEALRKFKCYVGMHTTRNKIEKLLEDFSFATFGELIAEKNYRGHIDV